MKLKKGILFLGLIILGGVTLTSCKFGGKTNRFSSRTSLPETSLSPSTSATTGESSPIVPSPTNMSGTSGENPTTPTSPTESSNTTPSVPTTPTVSSSEQTIPSVPTTPTVSSSEQTIPSVPTTPTESSSSEPSTPTVPSVPSAPTSASTKKTTIITEEYYEAKLVVNYLAVGIDTKGPITSSNTTWNKGMNDFLCVISFNLTDKTYCAIPINRDTMVQVDILGASGKPIRTEYRQIDYAHQFGDGLDDSFKNVERAVQRLLTDPDDSTRGVTIDRYIGFNMSAIPLINDFLGGVTITLEDNLTSLDPTWVKGATITLRGDDVEKYVRARSSVTDGTQLSRMRRQKVYLAEVAKMVRSANYSIDNIADLLSQIRLYSLMDVTTMDMIDMLGYIKDFTYLGIKDIPGETEVNPKTRYMEFYPYYDDLQALILDNFYTKKTRTYEVEIED